MRDTIEVLAEVQRCAEGWYAGECLIGNVRAGDIAAACRDAVQQLKAQARPTPHNKPSAPCESFGSCRNPRKDESCGVLHPTQCFM
jgi:hypothetical protein